MEAQSSAEWLPPGWTVEVRTKISGSKYKCYIAPLTGSKFYSKRGVFRYLKNGKLRSQASKPEKRSIKTPSDDFVLVQIEDSPEGLPPGWIREIKFRRRPSTNVVKRDPYYTDPVTGCVFRSKKDVLRYLKTGDLGKYAHKVKKTCMYDTHSLDKKYIPPNAAKRVRVSDNKPTWRLSENQSSNSDGMMTKLFNKSPTEEQRSPFTSHCSNQCDDDAEPTSLPLISPVGSKKGQRKRIQAEKQLQPVQLASGLSLKPRSGHGSAHIGADQAVEAVPGVWDRWAAEELDQLDEESDSKKPGSPLAFPFRDSWSDPCLEFAVKMLTGEIKEIST